MSNLYFFQHVEKLHTQKNPCLMWFCMWYQVFLGLVKQFIAVIGVIYITVDKCSPHVSFFSVDCQLLPTYLQHRVVPSALNPTHRFLSMTVNHLHKVLSEKDIQRNFLIDTEIVHPVHLVLPPPFITCIRCWEKKMKRSPLCS